MMGRGSLVILGRQRSGLVQDEAHALFKRWVGLGFDAWWGVTSLEEPGLFSVSWGRLIGAVPHLEGEPGGFDPYEWEGRHPHEDYPGVDLGWSMSRETLARQVALVGARLRGAGDEGHVELVLLYVSPDDDVGGFEARPFDVLVPEPQAEPEHAESERHAEALELIAVLVHQQWLEFVEGADVKALAGRLDVTKGAEAVEDVLLEAPEVEDLYCTTRELGSVLLRFWD